MNISMLLTLTGTIKLACFVKLSSIRLFFFFFQQIYVMSDIPFEELLKQQRQAADRKAGSGVSMKKAATSSTRFKAGAQPMKTGEMSAKHPVSVFRQVVSVPRKVRGRDPRFDSLSGNFNEGLYKKSYGFLDDMRKEEEEELSQIAKDRDFDEHEREEAKRALSLMKNQDRLKEKMQVRREIKRDLRKRNEERIKQGKNPVFMNDKEVKRLEAVRRFDALKKKGGNAAVQKALDKREKRRAQKERKKMPEFHSKV